MKLGVFTHVIHRLERGKSYAYSPYVREINLWFKHVEKAEVVAPKTAVTNGDFSAMESYRNSNFTFTKIPSFDLLNFKGALKASLRIPSVMVGIISAMRRADHLHIRCPGNIGLLACVCQIFFPQKPKTAKYAGNWDPEAKQPWSYQLQKWILSNTFLTRNMKVLVYGEWPDQTKNVVTFFTASFSANEREIINKDNSVPYKFLFVGNLVSGKHPEVAIQIVEELNKRNIPSELHIYGDGELKTSLENQTENKTYIHFQGNQSLEVLKQAYKDSHFLILASKSEGWPKAVAEAMFFGCIPIATAVSCIPWMLGGSSRGILISEREIRDGNPVESGLLDTFQKSRQFECFPETTDAVSENVSRTGFSETLEVMSGRNKERQHVLESTVEKIIELINQPEEMRRMSMEAQEWSQEYSLEKFEAAIKEILAPSP